jgi:hypothetical protein
MLFWWNPLGLLARRLLGGKTLQENIFLNKGFWASGINLPFDLVSSHQGFLMLARVSFLLNMFCGTKSLAVFLTAKPQS